MGCGGSSAAGGGALGRQSSGRTGPGGRPVSIRLSAKRTPEQIEAENAERQKNMEKELEAMLYAKKDQLREKSVPLIEKLVDDDVSIDKDAMSAQRKLAKEKAEEEQKWVIFSNLDTVTPEDKKLVAKFMNVCIKHVPGMPRRDTKRWRRKASVEMLNANDDTDDTVSVRSDLTEEDSKIIAIKRDSSRQFISAISAMKENQIRKESSSNLNSAIEQAVASAASPQPSNGSVSGDDQSKGNIFRLDRVAVSSQLEEEDLLNFSLPAGPISPAVADKVIDIYTRGGALSFESVHKLLRLGYKSLKNLPNTTHSAVKGDERLTVVGDLHGQLPDLLYILENAGLPSKTRKYLFNGDFVDRGTKGVEIMCILLALFLAYPESVILNRGNHEDFAICCAYGFQNECCSKYDDITFGMFVEVFNYLPLFSIINDAIFVLHAGLFHCSDASLEELNQIERFDFSLKDMPEGGESIDHYPRETSEFLKQLQRDALWSDPMDQEGMQNNPRGAGIAFGPDVCRKFLDTNKLKMLVRSHECCRTGFDRPFAGDDANLLCTIFSASNYGGGGNTAAYMVFSMDQINDVGGSEPYAVGDTGLQYSVFYFDIDAEEEDDDEMTVVGGSIHEAGASGLGRSSLYDLVVTNRARLASEFKRTDDRQTGTVTKAQWSEVMDKVLKLKLIWVTMISLLVPDDCFVSHDRGDGGRVGSDPDARVIKYNEFLESFDSNGAGSTIAGDDADERSDVNMIEALYAHHHALESVFRYFDRYDTGTITKVEFNMGVEELNEQLPETQRITDTDKLMKVLDVSERGEIDVNEFFEMFRLTHVPARRETDETYNSTFASVESTDVGEGSNAAIVIGRSERNSVGSLLLDNQSIAATTASHKPFASMGSHSQSTQSISALGGTPHKADPHKTVSGMHAQFDDSALVTNISEIKLGEKQHLEEAMHREMVDINGIKINVDGGMEHATQKDDAAVAGVKHLVRHRRSSTKSTAEYGSRTNSVETKSPTAEAAFLPKDSGIER